MDSRRKRDLRFKNQVFELILNVFQMYRISWPCFLWVVADVPSFECLTNMHRQQVSLWADQSQLGIGKKGRWKNTSRRTPSFSTGTRNASCVKSQPVHMSSLLAELDNVLRRAMPVVYLQRSPYFYFWKSDWTPSLGSSIELALSILNWCQKTLLETCVAIGFEALGGDRWCAFKSRSQTVIDNNW